MAAACSFCFIPRLVSLQELIWEHAAFLAQFVRGLQTRGGWLIGSVEPVATGCYKIGIHRRLEFINSAAYEMICFSDAFWLCINNNNKNSWPFNANFDPCLKTWENPYHLYLCMYYHILNHSHLFYLYEVGLQSSFVAYEHSYLLFYMNCMSSALITGS